MRNKLERLFVFTLLATLIIKIILAVKIPITGDEAYFYLWGRYPDLGYYDHPPMIGWILYLLLHFGKSLFVLRLPAIFLSSLVGVGIYGLLRSFDRDKAALAGILFLVSPLNVANVIVTTDTPLIFFSFLSVALLYCAVRKENYLFYLLSGVCFGLAFLSKYFSGLLGLAYLAYLVFSPKNKKKTLGFLLLFASTLPFIALNVYYNYTHCWANIMFNIINRNRGEVASIKTVLFYLFLLFYVITPPIIIYLWRRRKELNRLIAEDRLNVLPFVLFVPYALFALLSVYKTIGLHWLLSFYPFLFIVASWIFREKEFARSIKFMLYFSGLHLLLFSILLTFPGLLRHTKFNSSVVMGFHPQLFVQAVKPYAKDYFFATPSYATSAVMTYNTGKYFAVFGTGSYHARQDDILTDFRKLDGKNILILVKSQPAIKDFTPFFSRVEIKNFRVKGVPFTLILGRGFNYEAYKEKHLALIKEKYYRIPGFLPRSKCYFFDRYFSQK